MSETSRFVVIDYSSIYYADVAKTAPPAVRNGKFVQVRHGDTEYLLLSPREYSAYHSDIVERFCLERSIDGLYQERKKRFDILDAEWVVIGGGKYEMNEKERYIRFYDNSMAYGRFDAQGLREGVIRSEMFKGYEVAIE